MKAFEELFETAIQLCPESTTTLRQIAAFARGLPTAEPFGLTCMSATAPSGLLETVDNPAVGKVIEIHHSERTGALAQRLLAAQTARRLQAGYGDCRPATATARRLLETTGNS